MAVYSDLDCSSTEAEKCGGQLVCYGDCALHADDGRSLGSGGCVRFMIRFVGYTFRCGRSGWRCPLQPELPFIRDASARQCYDIGAVDGLLDHSDVGTTMVCIYVVNRDPSKCHSPHGGP